jgi:hypothetical protein
MAQYFFDLKSADTFSRDDDGVKLPDAEAAHDLAIGALVDLARDAVIEGSIGQHFAVEVRNGTGPVLEVTIPSSNRGYGSCRCAGGRSAGWNCWPRIRTKRRSIKSSWRRPLKLCRSSSIGTPATSR